MSAKCSRCVAAEADADRLRTVLRSLISSGGTSANIRAHAMNALDAGTGDAWLAGVLAGEWCAACRAPAAVLVDTFGTDGEEHRDYACEDHELVVRTGALRKRTVPVQGNYQEGLKK